MAVVAPFNALMIMAVLHCYTYAQYIIECLFHFTPTLTVQILLSYSSFVNMVGGCEGPGSKRGPWDLQNWRTME